MQLPSSVGGPAAWELVFGNLVEEEIQLRIGQANECLERLRTDLGHKSILYRQNFCSSSSVCTDTRSKKEIQRLIFKINKNVRGYNRAQKALQNLGAFPDVLGRFKLILPADLSVNKEVTEENRFGQGSDRLAWFWHVSGSSTPWTQECMFSLDSASMSNSCWSVYRVSWLKSKARFKRWEEELELVQNEMFWTTLWFKHQEREWERRWLQALEGGHRAYAVKQRHVWESFREKAEESFKGKMAIVK
ncbi:hypothetical protein PAXRUDRAFT_169612 [Paxillus rubicundulus Ve08.2h10]|uniref:Uncharacterized protein n=1 Tax=Paxillus rubicundulus Ve08.2h10 TaxID=930991 RepID=A0A0D0BZQ7_9AGAM|nr:hypothetical protein PAXRUDRAFT_169612 [Paxillus rubicundulus Ve08.2h10]